MLTMSRKLYQEDIIKILDIINHWEGGITWKLICDSVCQILNRDLTRQGLARHPEIVSAYGLAKLRCKQAIPVLKQVHLPLGAAENSRLSKLQDENSRLRKENERLLVMIRNLQLVAYSKCIREEQINKM